MKRLLLFFVIVAVLVLILAGAGGDISQLAQQISILMAGSTGLIAIVALALLGASLVFFGMFAARHHSHKTEIAEVMRVAQREYEKTAEPQVVSTGKLSERRQSAGRRQTPTPALSEIVPPKRLPSLRVRKGELRSELCFQPYFAIHSMELAGYEIFRRMNDPQTGRSVFIRSLDQLDKKPSRDEVLHFEQEFIRDALTQIARILEREETALGDAIFQVPITAAFLKNRRSFDELIVELVGKPHLASVVSLQLTGQRSFFGLKTIFRKLTNAGVRFSLDFNEHTADERQLDNLPEIGEVFGDRAMVEKSATDQADGDAETKPVAGDLGAQLIVRGLTCEEDMVDMIARGVDMVSGDFLAPPKPIRADLLSTA